MLDSPTAERARRRIVRLCTSGLGAPDLLAALAGAVREVVDYDGAVWATVDPATLLITGAHVECLPRESAAAFYENEYLHDDLSKFSRLARGVRPVATLSELTDGELTRGRIHREVGRHFGFLGDELRVAFVCGSSCWGVAGLVRRNPTPFFTQGDLSFVASVARHVGEGLRTALLLEALAGPASEEGTPGLVLVTSTGEVTAATPEAEAWLAELSHQFGPRPGERVPAALLAVAARALEPVDELRPSVPEPPWARLRTRSGRWLILHGSRLAMPGTDARAAIIIEPARAPEIAPLLVEAYGFSPRERDVAQQVMLGASTAEIARELFISQYTVQDHLKSIFDKVGVRSRGEMVKGIFDRHCAHRSAPHP